MARFKLCALALLVCSFFTSCGNDEVGTSDLYDCFLIVYLHPENWDSRLDEGLTATPEFLQALTDVSESIRSDRNAYASRCDGFSDPSSTACQSVNELDRVLEALADIQRTVRDGSRMSGSMSGLLAFGMKDDRRAMRTRVAERVKPYFEPK